MKGYTVGVTLSKFACDRFGITFFSVTLMLWYVSVAGCLSLGARYSKVMIRFYEAINQLVTGASQLVTQSTRHNLKSCDKLTILLNKVVTS